MLIASPMHTAGAAVNEMVRGLSAKDEVGQYKLARVSLRAGCVGHDAPITMSYDSISIVA